MLGTKGDEFLNFKQNCMICEEYTWGIYEKKQIKNLKAVHDSVHNVETLTFKNLLIGAAQQRNDNVVLNYYAL